MGRAIWFSGLELHDRGSIRLHRVFGFRCSGAVGPAVRELFASSDFKGVSPFLVRGTRSNFIRYFKKNAFGFFNRRHSIKVRCA